MSGYQTRLMADLNLNPPNSKTLALIIRLALRDGSQKKTKPLSGVLGGRSCLAPFRNFSCRWQAHCHSHLTSGKEVRGPEGSLSTPNHLLGRSKSIRGVVAVDSLTPLPLTSACTCRVRNHSPHPKAPPSKGTPICSLFHSTKRIMFMLGY